MIKFKNFGKKLVSAITLATLVSTLTACGSAIAGNNAAGSNTTADVKTDTNSTSTQAASQDSAVTTIKVATTGGPAPYMVVNEDGSIVGSDIEILQAIFNKIPGYNIEIIKADDPLTGLTSGLYDLAVNNYAWRDERGELYYYSLPYKTGYDVYIQRANDTPLTSLQDLADRGYKTEVSAGSNKALALEKWNSENPDHQITLVYSDSDFQIKFQNIVDGKTDVAIDDGPIFNTLIDQFGLENDLAANPIDADTQEFIAPHNSTYFLFPKTKEGAALREKVDDAIVALKKDGSLAKITEKYFGKDVSPAEKDLQNTLN